MRAFRSISILFFAFLIVSSPLEMQAISPTKKISFYNDHYDGPNSKLYLANPSVGSDVVNNIKNVVQYQTLEYTEKAKLKIPIRPSSFLIYSTTFIGKTTYSVIPFSVDPLSPKKKWTMSDLVRQASYASPHIGMVNSEVANGPLRNESPIGNIEVCIKNDQESTVILDARTYRGVSGDKPATYSLLLNPGKTYTLHSERPIEMSVDPMVATRVYCSGTYTVNQIKVGGFLK